MPWTSARNAGLASLSPSSRPAGASSSSHVGGAVAVQLDDGLVAERAGGAQRVGRVGKELPRAVRELDLEQVLEPGERRSREPQLPAPAPAPERRRRALGPVGDEPNAGELPPRVGQSEAQLVHGH